MRVPVSPKLFDAFRLWALAQPDAEALAEGAETWHDAPDSGLYRGVRALRSGGDKYNSVSQEAFARFLEATGTQTVESTVFSDRTGEHRCVRLAPPKGE